jgi:RNA ligase (TIGR02306 family)
MSEFKVFLHKITEVLPHPNADRLDIIPVRGYQCISGKGNFQVGDYAFYIPEQSIVPDNIIVDLNLQGMLSGSQKNRVKAIKLRKELSQGLLYPLLTAVPHLGRAEAILQNHTIDGEPADYSEMLGIKKHEPNVPAAFSGVMGSGGLANFLINYDFDNIKDHPDWFGEETYIVATEKLHGTLLQVVIDLDTGEHVISSKGLSKKKICLKNTEENQDNLYIKMVRELGIVENVLKAAQGGKIAIIGEIFGKGIQDLGYDFEKPEFRCFDIAYYVTEKEDHERGDVYDGWRFYCYEDLMPPEDRELYHSFEAVASYFDLKTVPVLFRGRYTKEIVKAITSGKSTFAPKQIKEGVVIKGFGSRRRAQKRFIVKSVSTEYLLREGDTTEFN